MPVIINGTTGISGVDGSAGTPSYQGTDTNTGVFFPAADVIAFSTSGTEDARFDSAGNFGIGTTSPSAKLNTSAASGGGSVIHYQLSETGTTGGSEMVIAANNTSFSWQAGAIGFLRESVANSYAIRFSTSSGGTNSERMRIDSSGNVGIGTSSPVSRLDVRGDTNIGTSATPGTTYLNVRNSNAVEIDSYIGTTLTSVVNYCDSTQVITGSQTSIPYIMRTNGTERMRINSAGQVTMPFQPAFFARRSSSYGITANIGTAQLDQTLLNVGNCFNTSTYRFTAPIAGNYFISASMSYTGISTTQLYMGAMIQKNGSNFISGYDCTTQTSSNYKLITINFIVPLAANDYITMLWDFNTGTATLNHDDSRTHLMGWLVG